MYCNWVKWGSIASVLWNIESNREGVELLCCTSLTVPSLLSRRKKIILMTLIMINIEVHTVGARNVSPVFLLSLLWDFSLFFFLCLGICSCAEEKQFWVSVMFWKFTPWISDMCTTAQRKSKHDALGRSCTVMECVLYIRWLKGSITVHVSPLKAAFLQSTTKQSCVKVSNPL